MSDWTGRRLVLGIADIILIGGAIGQAVCHTVWSMASVPRCLLSQHNTDHSFVLGWRPFPDRHRCRPCIMHRAALHPRTLPDASSGSNGRPQRRHDHPRASHCVWNRRWVCECEWRMAVDGWTEYSARRHTARCVGVPSRIA